MATRGSTPVSSLQTNEIYKLSSITNGVRMVAEWISSPGIICDLDLCVLLFDERARFIQKLTFDQPISQDKSVNMQGDINANSKGSSHEENVHLDLSSISSSTCAICFLIDGGQRNFQHVQRIVFTCLQENIEKDKSNFMNKVDPSLFTSHSLFQCVHRTKKDLEGIAHSILYRDGWHPDGTSQWKFKYLFEPLYTKSMKEKDELCAHLVVTTVPSLELYKPRLYPNVKALSSALSSTSLPLLKEKFQSTGGLDSFQFTETLFRSLHEIQPRLNNMIEAASTIAVLQEMFSQIDFNNDGTVDWDEFTTFCIQIGLTSNHDSKGSGGESVLDKYVVEYCEDPHLQDNIIKSHQSLALMKYLPELNRIMVIMEKAETVLMIDNQFNLLSTFDPMKLPQTDSHEKLTIYDICYLPARDMFAYCASDHSIVIVKEQCGLNGKRVAYLVYKRLLSNTLHVKLCWSDRCKILCSVASDNLVYGWDIEEQNPIFQVSRHKDTITDFLSIDSLEMFVTCSLDKRIVLWSQTSRRVKGVLLGHKRGVRFMSHLRGVLLSAGFECEAKTWDLSLKEPTLILRGHRAPISAGKIMCPDNEPLESLRAMTVDDTGEFRLWNIYVKERGSEPGLARVLQTFSMRNMPARIKFIELPFNPQCSIGAYSDIIAASSKLVHFTPEKNTAEFIPPKSICYSEPNNCLVTAIGHHLFKYDVYNGSFLTSHLEVSNADITSLCLDEYYGRRLYVGCANGKLLLINFATAGVIDSMVVHSKEILAIAIIKSTNHNMIFTGSLDGRIRYLEESSGVLTLHSTAEQPIGDNCGIALLRSIPSLKILVAASAGLHWGIYYALTFKRICLIEEFSTISSIEIISASGDNNDIEEHNARGIPFSHNHLISLAICCSSSIRIYTIDTLQARTAITHTLSHSTPLYLSEITFFRMPRNGSINYIPSFENITSKYEELLIATSDEGYLVLWDARMIRNETRAKFHQLFPTHHRFKGSTDNSRASTTGSDSRALFASDNILESESKEFQSFGDSFHEELVENEHFDDDEDDNMSDQLLGVKLSCLSPAQAKKRRYAMFMRSQKSMSQFILDTQNTEIAGLNCIATLDSIKAHRVHGDVIACLVPLLEHGCVITCSLDGFQRIFNLNGECLGEMPLPNITEKMKERSAHTNWKFLLEKIPVKDSHRDIASKLLKSIYEGQLKASNYKYNQRRKGQIQLSHTTSFGEKLVKRALTNADNPNNSLELLYQNAGFEKTERTEKIFKEVSEERLRKSMLQELKKPYQGNETSSEGPNDPSSGNVGQVHSIWSNNEKDPLRPSTSLPSPNMKKLDSEMDEKSFTKSINSRASTPNHQNLQPWNRLESLVPHNDAFSEHSISTSIQQGLIDAEGHQLLRKVNHDQERKEIFSRSVPQLLLKNISLSSKVEMPAISQLVSSEILFGEQKDMYRNANTLFTEKRISKSQIQHSVSVARIKRNIRRIGPLLRTISPPVQDVSELPPITSSNSGEISFQHDPILGNLGEKSNEPDTSRSINKDRLAAIMEKVHEATEPVHHSYEKKRLKSPSRKHELKRAVSSVRTNADVLEKKLVMTIKSFFRNTGTPNSDIKILNTRALLPYYKLIDVKHFLDAFQKVDEDYSGDLDVDEWCNFLTSFNKSLSKQHARTIFNHVDVNGEGVLSVRDLIPVVFSKANKDQQALITKYMEIEISKRKAVGKDLLSEADLRKLFEYYDEDALGFISVDLLREKIKALQLPEVANEAVLGKVHDMDSDEMLNPSDFVRIFHQYLLS